MRRKKAAIELSIGTVVIIVLAMTMLILGLVLVRSIFTGANDSVNTLNEKVKGEIANLFTEEGSRIAMKLGSARLVKIKQGTENFGIAVGVRKGSGEKANEMRYKLTLMKQDGDESCNPSVFKDYVMFHRFSGCVSGTSDCTSDESEFEDIEEPDAFVILTLNIPKDADSCLQRIKFQVVDNVAVSNSNPSSTFRVQITKKGIFS